jgi:hypothetical protein
MEKPMDVLTESMARLRDEILVLRHNRMSLRSGLAESVQAIRGRVVALRQDVANDLAGARRVWRGPDVAARTQKKSRTQKKT